MLETNRFLQIYLNLDFHDFSPISDIFHYSRRHDIHVYQQYFHSHVALLTL